MKKRKKAAELPQITHSTEEINGIIRPYAEISTVASSTECTGLTQTIPDDNDEEKSYKHIYDIPLK